LNEIRSLIQERKTSVHPSCTGLSVRTPSWCVAVGSDTRRSRAAPALLPRVMLGLIGAVAVDLERERARDDERSGLAHT
jgi:hypothetical protein